jgi:nucleotide-binding universal stress UspA family protein
MFKKIIWATDGSESADRALAVATSIASGDGGTLLAVHSVEYMVGKGEITVDVDDSEQVVKIKQQVAELKAKGLQADARVVQGGMSGAAHTVAKVAQEEGADLIVAGTRGHTQLAGLLLGSVTQRLIGIAPCPVLVVPGAAK